MAILQISKITNRKGYMADIPQLDGGELGWALDERRLFIGNGDIADGSPVIGNTELLTEYSNLLETAANYTYKGLRAGYVANETIVRTLQDKTDEIVSVQDFGAIGDGITDDTVAINSALYELFCRSTNTSARRSLYFPAGIYKTTDIIKIPPFAIIYGDGIDSSIIRYERVLTTAVDIVPGSEYEIISTGNTNFISIGAPDSNPGTIFTATGPALGSGTVKLSSISEFVATTSDSFHQIGINIGNPLAGDNPTNPTTISVATMNFESNEKNSVFSVVGLTDSSFDMVRFKSVLEIPDLGNLSTYNTSAIHIAEVHTLVPTNITFSNCITSNTSVGLNINTKSKGIRFENGRMYMHYQGVSIGGEGITGSTMPLPINQPTGTMISRTIFDDISDHGILFGNVAMNSSAYNVFYNVGNNFLTPSNPSPIISMFNGDNISIGDLFERPDDISAISPRIDINGTSAIAFDSTSAMFLGSYTRTVGVKKSFTASGELFTLLTTDTHSYEVNYTMRRNNQIRSGAFRVSATIDQSLSQQPDVTPAPQTPPFIHIAQSDDNYTESADIRVELTAEISLTPPVITPPDPGRIPTGTRVNLVFLPTGTGDLDLDYSILRLD